MKNSHLIISNLKNTSALSKLKDFDEIQRFINSLTLEVRKYISFAHKKEKILFVSLKNPNFCKEFNAYIAPNALQILHSNKAYFPLLSLVHQVKAYYPQKLKSTSFNAGFTKEELEKQLKSIKTYKKRRELIEKFQKKGQLHFLPPKHFASYNQIIKTFYLQSYEEQSQGEFQNLATNPKLHRIFESIRNVIKSQNET